MQFLKEHPVGASVMGVVLILILLNVIWALTNF
jgi:hypothetical protein